MKRLHFFTLVLLGSLLGAGVAQAGPVPVKEVKASSTLPQSQGQSFDAARVLDGTIAGSWAEGDDAAGLGNFLDFQFQDEVTLTRIEVYGGNFDSKEFFNRTNRLKSIQLKFSSGAPVKMEFKDLMERQVLTLPAPVKTRSVRLVIKEVYAGSTFNDTYIAEVRFFDAQPGEVVEGVKAKATTALPPDSAASYGADKLLDGLTDTPWCEGRKDTGVGERLTFTLPSPTALKELRLLNGVNAGEEPYKKNNRITKIKLEAGTTVIGEFPLADERGAWQVIPLNGQQAATLTMTILEVAKGSAYNDACLSEAQLIPQR